MLVYLQLLGEVGHVFLPDLNKFAEVVKLVSCILLCLIFKHFYFLTSFNPLSYLYIFGGTDHKVLFARLDEDWKHPSILGEAPLN